MKILQIAPKIPWPLDDGSKLGIFAITDGLSKRGVKLHLAAPCLNIGNLDGFPSNVSIHPLPIRTENTIWSAAKNLFSPEPYNISKYFSNEMLERLSDLVKKEWFDAIHVDHLHLARYAIELKRHFGIPTVLREHNFESEIIHRYALLTKNPLLALYAGIQYRRVLRYEAWAVQGFDIVIPISREDDSKLRGISPRMRSRIIPAGVKVDSGTYDFQFRPKRILFFTNYSWAPNKDSFRFYHEEIFPEVRRMMPETLTIVAGKETERIPQSNLDDGFSVVGFVPDLTDLRKLSSVAVVPLRIGSGVRIKMLELMALGFTVVATSLGAEGIDLADGEHAVLAETPHDIAAALVRLLNSPRECSRIGMNARNLIGEKYSWDAIGQEFYDLYAELIGAA
ncbi:MAG: glycosyltransferase family 4 protein [Bacteroidetes bacterium]|nr:glycosyltransferase family 4 protein [Bacteroidota bacterium]MCL5738964.1 glycosyltransferase family 4 protein [Bacteroidota bacterium]